VLKSKEIGTFFISYGYCRAEICRILQTAYKLYICQKGLRYDELILP